MAANPVIVTKLFVPPRRPGVVERHRIDALLERGARSALTLISAPAGFGKTTAVAAWLHDRPATSRALAWLSVDQSDNEPQLFWNDVIAALEKAAAATGATLGPIARPGEHPIDAVLASLVNEVNALPTELDLVLDDYHLVEQPEVHAGMQFLIEHLPPQIHLIITTRADPALPLARLRARGELVEIRSADLRFNSAEVAAYLNGKVGLGLSATNVAALEDRTEGWAAALQLAALSMQGRADVNAFIADFAGHDRYVFDYLIEEVLGRQSEAVRLFLLQTCFLERLSGPLCDAVIGGEGSRATLDALDRANLFLVPLDDRREWYRYHHLFADVLQTHFADELRTQLPGLHQRASGWHAAQGHVLEAIQHALAAADFERAAGLIEFALPDMQRNRGEATIRRWAHELPRALVRTRPVLGIGLVGGLVSFGEFDDIEDRLRDVEHGLQSIAARGTGSDSPAVGIVVADEAQLPRVPGAVELYRAALAQIRGDMAGLIEHAKTVLDVAPADDHLARAAGSSMLGIAYWSQGNLTAAHQAWSTGKAGLQRAGHIADTLGVSVALADILSTQGRLREAMQTYEQALQVAEAQDRLLRGTADMHAGLSQLLCERNDLDAARRHLVKSEDLGERAGLPQHPYRWRVAMALVKRAEGNLDEAANLLDEAERLYVSDFFPNVRPVSAMRARVWIAQGRIDDALRWQRDSGLAVDDDLVYLREFEHLTLARLLLAQPAGAKSLTGLLDRLLHQATHGARMGSVIEISILQALAHETMGGAAAPLVPLERALSLAEPEGYTLLFCEWGERMVALLKAALKRGITPAYTRRLLAACGQPAAKPMATRPELLDALSDRELDVLRLLRSELGGPEIARELMISLNTMRTHTKNIYEKLGVSTRRSAVNRAEELSLLTRARP